MTDPNAKSCWGAGNLAPGFWGGSPYLTLQAFQIPDQIKVQTTQELITGGRPCLLYLPVSNLTEEQLETHLDGDTIECTCDKNTTKNSDDRCRSCYGVRICPGYVKFLTFNIFAASAEYELFTPNADWLMDRNTKPNRIMLADTATTAQIVTQDKPFTNTRADAWEYDLAAPLGHASNTVTVEFSTDSGTTWYALSAINSAVMPTGTGTIRFRITMTRSSTTIASPRFEILRLRHLRSADVNLLPVTQKQGGNDPMTPGQILIARTYAHERTSRAIVQARTTEHTSDQGWTVGLEFFDTTIVADTPSVLIKDRSSGPHPFYVKDYGVDRGTRYAIYGVDWNEELFLFSKQQFTDRRIQDNEGYYLCW